MNHDACFEVLKPYHDDLNSIVANAHKILVDDLLPVLGVAGKTVMAANMHHLMIREARQRLLGRDGVQELMNASQQFPVFVIGGQLAVRFKKLNRRTYAPETYATHRAREFDGQATLLELPWDRVNVGYVLNEHDTEIEAILVVKTWKHREPEWWYEIPAAVVSAPIVLGPTGDHQEQRVRRRLVQRRIWDDVESGESDSQ
jgi:hypothetical protein